MSGPKVDYAKLREQEMASLAEARGRRLKVADKIQKMINQIIKSHIPSDKDGVESGEQLALKSFYKGHSKLFDSVFMSG